MTSSDLESLEVAALICASYRSVRPQTPENSIAMAMLTVHFRSREFKPHGLFAQLEADSLGLSLRTQAGL